MASEKEEFVTKLYVPTGEPIRKNAHVTIYKVRCMKEPGRPEALLKLYHNKNCAKVYERLKQLNYTEWPRVHDVKFFDGNTLVVEDYLKGATMQEIMEGKRAQKAKYTEAEAQKIMARITEAVKVLNEIQPPLSHGNLKKSNIFITSGGHVKFLDFEPADPKKPRFNLFEFLGRLFHELLTGREPKGKVSYEGRYKKVIEKCLEVNPDKQYTDIMEMQEDVEEAKEMEYEEPESEDVITLGIPYVLTLPFQGMFLVLEWILFSFFFQKNNTTNAALFGAIFGVHLLIFIWRRWKFIHDADVRLDHVKLIFPILLFIAVLAVIYIGVGRFIVPIT
ncbi:MAG: hypothetical protein VZQ83_06345 [Eubacterium sp.]|nr:hypothetical protein [Eubacterium sp.]